MSEPQSILKEKDNPGILKDDFCQRADSSILTSIALVLLDWSNKTNWVFPALKSKRHFLLYFTVSYRSNSSSEAYFRVVLAKKAQASIWGNNFNFKTCHNQFLYSKTQPIRAWKLQVWPIFAKLVLDIFAVCSLGTQDKFVP